MPAQDAERDGPRMVLTTTDGRTFAFVFPPPVDAKLGSSLVEHAMGHVLRGGSLNGTWSGGSRMTAAAFGPTAVTSIHVAVRQDGDG